MTLLGDSLQSSLIRLDIRVVLPKKEGALQWNNEYRTTAFELHYLLYVTKMKFRFFRIPGTTKTLQYFLVLR